jgi:hypothetical protein
MLAGIRYACVKWLQCKTFEEIIDTNMEWQVEEDPVNLL